ncbi:MAG TPA: helix-turn-helix domain-containing protein [Candidatus Dormibacteraeota bacterium]|jgi:predicted ArsR family transcriptional regulator|nr:helix-turn-helix domain-containing protein [Candidatus Dormibacteraeota bacterium]
MLEAEDVVNVLADRTRRSILLAFYADPRPRTAGEVAAEAGVHRTVAFSHLERLVQAGFLATEVRRGRRGRPAKLYRLGSRPVGLWYPPRRFLELSQLLAEALGQLGPPGVRAAFRAGRQWSASIGDLAAIGDQLHREGDRIVVTSCVFREACREGEEVVCWLHAGVLEGVLGGAVRPLGRTDRGCVFHLDPVARPEPVPA